MRTFPQSPYAPEAQLLAESEDAAALRDLFYYEHHYLQKRAKPGEQQCKKEKTEGEGKPHLAVDHRNAGD